MVLGGYLPCPGGVYLVWYSPVDRMTHAYENITLPQTAFAGGNNRLPGETALLKVTTPYLITARNVVAAR